jgi:Zn-dependent protease with chaperone function
MDFFQRQDEARHRTTQLLVYFGLGIITLTALIYILSAFVFLYLGASADQRPTLWDPSLFSVVTLGVLIVVGIGSLIKAGQLASGGKSVALMLDGQEVSPDTTDLRERRLLNVVEEMALASGVPVPPVYILPEKGINAFAAGHGPGDTVVAVSQGCLTYLTRDELQGVIGHEFSHVLNGDVRLNLRLVAWIFGIMAVSQVGWVVMQLAGNSRSSDDKKGGGGIFILGLGLYLLGLGGAFFGWLIQAAVSRQREHLADASAVQFTRNPDGICGALKKIGGLEIGSQMTNPHAGEVSHMFMADAFMGKRLTGLFDTHPPLEERIRQLDAQWDGTYPEVKPVDVGPEEARGPQRGRVPPLIPGLPSIPGMPQVPVPVLALANADSATAHVGHLRPQHVSYAASLQTKLPDVLRDAVQSPFSARALIYCLLLDTENQTVREAQLAQLQAGAEPRDYDQTLRLIEAVDQLPEGTRLPLVEWALPALRQMSPSQHQVFRGQVEALIHADNRVSLFEYALHCMLSRFLDMDYNRRQMRVRYRAPEQVAPRVATVLSLLAWAGQDDPAAAQVAFAKGMRAFSETDTYALTPRAQCSLRDFHAALQTLAEATPEIKKRVVAACAACIMADGKVTVREGELLRAISATLGCPMPPLVAEAGN